MLDSILPHVMLLFKEEANKPRWGASGAITKSSRNSSDQFMGYE